MTSCLLLMLPLLLLLLLQLTGTVPSAAVPCAGYID